MGNASLQAYIEEFVEPNINEKARKLAKKFDSFMSFILPKRAPRVDWSNYLDKMRSFTASVPDPDDGSQPTIINKWQSQWLDRLTEIFEIALKWKTRVTKNCNGYYTFGFPPYMTKYERWLARVRDAPSSLDGNPKSRVLLTLMPSVSVRNRSRLSENIRNKPWSTIYQALVLVGPIG